MSLFDQSIQSAMLRVSFMLKDPEVLLIPVRVVGPEAGIAIAATDLNGLVVSEHCLSHDPGNLPVYITHEIFHHVVEDHTLTHKFDGSTLNRAYDFKINALLKTLYGADVKAVKFKGLYSKAFVNKSVEEIAEAIYSPLSASKSKFFNTQAHPILISVANRLRKQLGFVREDSLLKFDFSDTYYPELRKHYGNVEFKNLPNIHPDAILRALWVRYFSHDLTYNKDAVKAKLTNTQVLSIVPKIDNRDTLGDPELSMFGAIYTVNFFNNSEKYVSRKLADYEKRLRSVQDRIGQLKKQPAKTLRARRLKIQAIEKARARRESLKLRRSVLLKAPLLSELLLADNQVAVRKSTQLIPHLSKALVTKQDAPKYDRANKLVRHILWLQKLSNNLSDIVDTYNRLKDLSEDFASDADADEDGELEDTPNNSANGEPDPDLVEDSSEEDSTSFAGKGAGKNKGNNNKLASLDAVAAHPKTFKAILNHAQDFGEKLLVKRASKISDTGLVDRTLSFGSDLSKVPYSDLGRLGNDLTQLSFFVDLANGNLLQQVDLDPRRSPLILLLDCSGSMHGSMYEIAAGFCLSLIAKLQSVKRSCALVKFSERIDSVFVWDGEKAKLPELLEALATPSMGGTCFNTALNKAFKIHADHKWARSQVLLISDAYDTIADHVIASKPHNCKTTAVIVSSKRDLVGVDECVFATRSNFAIELTTAGNAVL